MQQSPAHAARAAATAAACVTTTTTTITATTTTMRYYYYSLEYAMIVMFHCGFRFASRIGVATLTMPPHVSIANTPLPLPSKLPLGGGAMSYSTDSSGKAAVATLVYQR